MIRHKLLLLAFLFSFIFPSEGQEQLIPQPQYLHVAENGRLAFDKEWRVNNSVFANEAVYLVEQLRTTRPESPAMVAKKGNVHFVKIAQPSADQYDYYELKIDKKGITISAATGRGAFYGVQTLLQLVVENKDKGSLPYLEIKDYAKFSYRGMHLDVCRHFFTVKEVKNYLDYLSWYKINTFHWHLTDDQGWRIEIKSHPKLTEIGAYRKKNPYVEYEVDRVKDGRYGGFYTQDQIKDVVAYATKLHIDVIPEIEMPGHAQAALAAYPELSCTGGPFEVGTTWGVMDDIFCPKEETFALLEDVIDEVIALFPNKYIHIGGDEAPKTRWKSCPHCQALIKKEGLKNEAELQSYFIKRMEKYINKKGKRIIGWDEILEGGLAPDATVMSWTGIEGAIHAAKTGHDAIMTPVSHMYFDYYQGNPQSEPLAFSAEIRLDQAYSFNPIPTALNQEEAKHILGPQANMWTEYIPNFRHVQYMLFPRLFALSEVAWGTSQYKSYTAFEKRVIEHMGFLKKKDINYSKAIFEIGGNNVPRGGKMYFELSTINEGDVIRYTVDGSIPTDQSLLYKSPIPVDKTMRINAASFSNGKMKSPLLSQEFLVSKSTGKSIELLHKASSSYSANGNSSLVDGVYGNKNYFKRDWLGFNGQDLIATIDLGESLKFTTVALNTVDQKGSWIHYPKAVKVSVSNDGKVFDLIATVGQEDIDASRGTIKLNFKAQEARFVRVEVEHVGKIPAGFPGAGNDSWLFVDELSVY